jgi:hypothetical protein
MVSGSSCSVRSGELGYFLRIGYRRVRGDGDQLRGRRQYLWNSLSVGASSNSSSQ